MKKILWILVLFVLMWLIKLSYDQYLVNDQLTALQDQLHKSEQTVANLNDQLVAAQRKSLSPQPPSAIQSQNHAPSSSQEHISAQVQMSGIEPAVMIKQKLKLIQFALEQREFVYAVDQLNQMSNEIISYPLAETLKQALQHAILKDKQMIAQYVSTRTAQLSQLNTVLQQLDRELNQQQNSTQLSVGAPENGHFWQKWFQIERVDQQAAPFIARQLMLKEVQLRVVLAQQALLKGDLVQYQTVLSTIEAELKRFPDHTSRNMLKTVSSLKSTQGNPIPKLSAASILE